MADSGTSCFSKKTISAYENKYDGIIAQEYEKSKCRRYKQPRTDEKSLLNRLVKYKENHLLFLRVFRIPFDDNMSEWNLRKAKNHQKMAGGFRKEIGHRMYCDILPIIETMKRRKLSIINSIRTVSEQASYILAGLLPFPNKRQLNAEL